MKFYLVGFSLLSTLAVATKEDCYETLQGDDFTEFYDGIEDANFEDIPTLCSDIGGDFFSYSGPITCENGDHEDVIDIDEQFNCLPTICTDDEDVLDEILVEINKPQGSGRDQCFGSFEYEGLGDGIPQSMQCGLDMTELFQGQVWTHFYDQMMVDLMLVHHNQDCWEYTDFDVGDDVEIPSECIIKYTNAARACEESDGMDFFFYSRVSTLSDGTIDEVIDAPSCFPSSCTSNEEVLKPFLLPASDSPDNSLDAAGDEHSFVFTDIDPAENGSDENGSMDDEATLSICRDPPKEVKFQISKDGDEVKSKNCAWARKNAKKRCKLFPEIEQGCPMTCGGCDSTAMFILDKDQEVRSCVWAKRKEEKIKNRCKRSPTSEMCPSVCESWPSLE